MFPDLKTYLTRFILFIPLLMAAGWLLVHNEISYDGNLTALKEMQPLVLSLPGPQQIDTSAEGKPVYVTGRAETEAVLTDNDFGLNWQAMRLRREVEYYQWKETLNGERDPSYNTEWVTEPIRSSSFRYTAGHENVVFLPNVAKFDKTADCIRFGAFILSEEQKRKLHNTEIFQIKEEQIPEHLRGCACIFNGWLYVGNPQAAKQTPTQENEEQAVATEPAAAAAQAAPPATTAGPAAGQASAVTAAENRRPKLNPNNPQVGNIRVRWRGVPAEQDISVVARQRGKSFTSYFSANECEINLLQQGDIPLEKMFKNARKSEGFSLWLCRFIAFLLMLGACSCFLSPLSALLSSIPVLGSLLRGSILLFSLLLSLMLCLAIIALAKLYVAPLQGALLIVCGVAIFFAGRYLYQKRGGEKETRERPALAEEEKPQELKQD